MGILFLECRCSKTYQKNTTTDKEIQDNMRDVMKIPMKY